MSSLVRDFENIHEGWEMSLKAKKMINAAKDHIEEMLKNQQFRKFIIDKILSNYTDEQKKMLDERRSRQENMFNESATYSFGASDDIFDPEVDEFEIQDVMVSSLKGVKRVRIYVEDLKARGYLGITGMWIPKTYNTDWFDLDELEKAEDC